MRSCPFPSFFFSPVIADLEAFRSYLEKRFDFEQVTVKKFRTWAERRQFNRDMKRKQAESERPILPANQKLITLSVQDAPTKKGSGGARFSARDCFLAGGRCWLFEELDCTAVWLTFCIRTNTASAISAPVASQSSSIAGTTGPCLAAVATCQHQIMEMRTRVSSTVALLFSDMREARLTSERTVEHEEPPGWNWNWFI